MQAVMSIAGSDSSGGAGVQADLRTFAALGVYGTAVITSVTAQDSEGVRRREDVSVGLVREQIEAVVEDIGVDFAKTGMLASSAIVECVAEALRRYDVPFVLDPVLEAGAGGTLLDESALPTLVEKLLPLAAVTTPNVAEASVISGIEITDEKSMRAAALRIYELGVEAVVITGGHFNRKGADLLYDGEFLELRGEIIQTAERIHGAGCTFSAALAAELAKGRSLREAVAAAKRFVTTAISGGWQRVGRREMLVVDQLFTLRKAESKLDAIKSVKTAVKMLRRSGSFVKLIPEVGVNVGMAAVGAESAADVAAVCGRIRRCGNEMAAGCVELGASEHVARVILAAMEFNAEIRAAMNVRLSSEILEACRQLGLKLASFSRAEEPTGVKTLDWGVREAARRWLASQPQTTTNFPDAVYDWGAEGKEPMLRLFGKNAVEVAERALKLSEMLSHDRKT
ncbi:MAG: Hydroxymethylpyrimidine/phosphomethylpyrimidine kinase [Candidatus Alkanophagales archaeon MCA70_species_2]|nr:Hydroxymethylpyrimidine/phosphomethylpyrimidine kinase [Candidatus Alkanophaga liquidiphilum]